MAANRALAELDQRAGDDVRAFNRDADRHRAIERSQIVLRPFDHGLAAVHVHGVVDGYAQPLRRLALHDRGDHRRVVALINSGAGVAARRVEQIGGSGHAAESFLDRLEFTDR